MANTKSGVFPTKGNLAALKKQYALAKLGYELLDRKRNIMMREMLAYAENAAKIQEQTDKAFFEAYDALKIANITMGQQRVREIAGGVAVEDNVTVRSRSVMGAELPEYVEVPETNPLQYSFFGTDAEIDDAYIKFRRASRLAARQAATENGVYRLAFAIKQARKRANALKNVVIPDLEEKIAYISSYLEEKEREEFGSLKLVKKKKNENRSSTEAE